MTETFSIVSLFSGIGGLDLGFEQRGFEVVWANELYKFAADTYERNFTLAPVCDDIMEISLDVIPKADVVIGGPPCQSFSLVGQRRPDDERGKLVFRFVEVVRAVKPLAFVMENVGGMAASRWNGRALPDVLVAMFEDLGYQVSKMLLTATDYLVPQRRRRIFIVGCLRSRPQIPDGEIFARDLLGLAREELDISSRAAIGDLGAPVVRGERANYADNVPSKFSELMRERVLPDVSLHELPRMSCTDRLLVDHIPPGGNYRDVPDDIAPGRILKFKQTGGRTTTYGRLHPDEPSYTINTYFRRPNVGCNFHYSEPRLITPREAMRFQSIPDHFEIVRCSQDQRNALIGNAVPPLLANAVAWSVQKSLTGERFAPQQPASLDRAPGNPRDLPLKLIAEENR